MKLSFNVITYVSILAFVLCGFFYGAGCRKEPETRDTEGFSARETESQWNEQLLQYAVKNLQRLDEFQGGEMRQQVIDRLNQWIRVQKVPDAWRTDPMIETLPGRLREIPALADLGKPQFTRRDGFVLQQDVWLRDISNWARGDRLEDMARAKNLFDWTVRNIQIEGGGFGGDLDIPQWPWETLLLGRGTAVDRAWVFTLLARQQGIDAILLALPAGEDEKKAVANNADGDAAGATPQGELRIWAVGVLDQGKIYLFDSELGLPIPAAGGVKFDGSRLDIQPATLAEAAEDAGVLRRLDVDKEKPYPVTAARLAGAVGLVVASPASLSARMAMFEEKLSGDERVVLTDNASDVAKRFRDAGRLAEIRLWRRPFELMQKRDAVSDSQRQAALDEIVSPFKAGGNQPLWRGRTLYFEGVFTGDESATYYYQKARPSDQNLVTLHNDLMQLDQFAKKADSTINAYRRAKQDATYWLGLIASLEGDTRVAEDYLLKRTLDDYPDGPWTGGAKYNLARTYESTGEFKKAIAWFTSDTQFAGRMGNMLRAKWLETQLAVEREMAKKKEEAQQPRLPGLQE